MLRDVDSDVKLVVSVHHGGSRDSTTYFDRVVAAREGANEDRPGLGLKVTTMVLAPSMTEEQHLLDRPDRHAARRYPSWDGGWREGAHSVNDPDVRNYDLLDGMVRHVAEFCPGVKECGTGVSLKETRTSRRPIGTPSP